MGNRNHIGTDSTERFRREMDDVSQPLALDTGTWWWVWGKAIRNGKVKRVLRGPHTDEQSCRDAGNSLMGRILISFECVPLNTRDEAAASRIMRSRVAEEAKSADEAFQRFAHKVKESHPDQRTSAWGGPES
jgi:hypothetical protein